MKKKEETITCCSPEQVQEAFQSELLKAISEPVRMGLIQFLTMNGPSDIKTISANFSQDRSVISRHLQVMHRAGLVDVAKESRQMVYSVNGPNLIAKIGRIMEICQKLFPNCCKREKENP